MDNSIPFDIEKFKAGWLDELLRRQLLIKSEPDGIVRETMIDNLLIDLPPSHIPDTGKMGFEEWFKSLWGGKGERLEGRFTIKDLQAAFEAGNKNRYKK